jgi:hypothetical protein
VDLREKPSRIFVKQNKYENRIVFRNIQPHSYWAFDYCQPLGGIFRFGPNMDGRDAAQSVEKQTDFTGRLPKTAIGFLGHGRLSKN